MITQSQIQTALCRQVDALPLAFSKDGPPIASNRDEEKYINAFRTVELFANDSSKRRILFTREMRSEVFKINIDDSLVIQVRKIYEALRKSAECMVGEIIIREKIKKIFADSLEVLYGKYELTSCNGQYLYTIRFSFFYQ